jgi:uncharacterized protein (DUF885 family)
MNLKPFIKVFIVFFLSMGIETNPINASSTPGSKLLNEIADQFWELMLKDNLFLRQKYGLKIERLPRFTFEEAEADLQVVRSLLQKLQSVKATELNHDEELTLGILEWQLDFAQTGHRFFWLNIPISPYSCPFPWLNQFLTDFPFKEKGDLDLYLRLLEQYPGFVEDMLSILNRQYQMKIILAKPALEQMIPYLEALLQPADKNMLYVTADRLQKVSPQGVEDFQHRVSDIITTRINPSFKKMVAFIKADYFKDAPEQVGLWQYPQGPDYYKYLVRYHTSLDLTPEEVHQTGLKEIERLLKELDHLQGQVQFKGDRAAFIQFLKTDPRFLAPTVQAYEEKLVFYKEQAESKLDLFFTKKPQAPCGVKRLDPLLESSMTFGYYQVPTASDPKGYYLYNGANSKTATLVFAADLMLHELIPGHHFQLALQSENNSLPKFRREMNFTSYVEGWGEYAADLGEEMGIYSAPYVKCGRIMGDLFMAVRLVVDTGMNYFKWPRQKAMNFMKQHHLLVSDTEIQTETLRYAAGAPGQALAYKIGNMKMLELLDKAKQTWGDKFDIRTFHDAVLNSGAMPLKLLEKHLRWFKEKK